MERLEGTAPFDIYPPILRRLLRRQLEGLGAFYPNSFIINRLK